jgi:hypothetical protein
MNRVEAVVTGVGLIGEKQRERLKPKRKRPFTEGPLSINIPMGLRRIYPLAATAKSSRVSSKRATPSASSILSTRTIFNSSRTS